MYLYCLDNCSLLDVHVEHIFFYKHLKDEPKTSVHIIGDKINIMLLVDKKDLLCKKANN